ncbi:DNA polymerase/3'-5' exonuclease PolX, partial [Candidatus Woesearchaeota archaeon]
ADIAKIFKEMAEILEMKNVKWKPNAYNKASRVIEIMTKDLEEIYNEGGVKALEKINGVGEGMAEKIEEYIKTGKIKEYEKLKKSLPKGLLMLLDIPGMGPKKAKVLYQKLKIKNINDLQKAVEQHKVAKLEHFKEKSEENILKGIKLLKSSKGRVLLGTALPLAENLVANLKKCKAVKEVNLAGSIRRGRETVKDVDILVVADNAKDVMDYFVKIKDVKDVVVKGLTKTSVLLKNNMQVDLRVVKKESYGAALQYFTGNKDHNVKLRELAIKKGYKLSEYGLFSRTTGKPVPKITEKKIYNKLGLPYIPPEMRENMGELELKKVPKLVELKDIKGDLHMHTNYSDGFNTIEEMIKAAKQLGYEYINLTDHSPTETVAHGLNVDRLNERNKEIRKVAKKVKGIKVFIGSEVDILKDGSLDYDDSVLKKLDIVVASVHRNFKMSKEKMTERIVQAVSNKHVKILAHPMTRKLNEREPITFDVKTVFDECIKNNVAIEINSQPKRLDLDFMHVKQAKEMGAKFVINTDAHSVNQLNNIRYGVTVARRGWLEKKNVINALSLNEFVNYFKL